MVDSPKQLAGIAIVGLACRFPGARDADAFWRNLRDGVESIRRFTDEELIAAGVDRATLEDPNYVRVRPQLEDIDLFDAGFFGFNPREAETLDPQQRVFLECVSDSLDNAGCDPDRFAGRIGLFAGANISTYLLNNLLTQPGLKKSGDYQHVLLGNDKDYLTTRVSMKLNLRGPSIAVQTACSTSLVAVHLACQSLLDYEADLAVAGGVSIEVPQQGGYFWQEGGILSPDGHCRSFDARAAGTVFGSGIGVVVLKRLEEALRDGDQIRAVVRGSAINNDGSAKVGYTAPSVQGQAEVIAEALAVAGVEAGSVSYIEAHGTATELGDPIEVEALSQVFKANTERRGFCALGSVKSNFGHLNKAAGIAGLIKTVLALEHKQLPPSLHYEAGNPKIDFANSPFYVNAELRAWENGNGARRAGVSSFGIGGTNAHVVLEEGPAVARREAERAAAGESWELLPLTAKTTAALGRVEENLGAHLAAHPELGLGDVSHTLQVGRRHFNQRGFVVSRSVADTVAQLAAGKVARRFSEGRNAGVVFLFPGQGAQYAGMGRQLFEQGGVYREVVDECSEQLRGRLGLDLRELLYPEAGAAEAAERELAETWLTQPALFVTEYGLARWWQSLGVQPWGMLGHSIGEYVAACLAGVFKLADGLALVAERGRLMQGLTGGAMVGLGLEVEEVEPLLKGQLAVAALNGPGRVVVSGPEAEVQELEEELAQRGVSGRRLRTSHAFHSPLMEPMLGEFERVLRGVELSAPQLNYISNVTGDWVKAEEATDPGYWVTHARRAVRFGAGLERLLSGGERVVVEVGPGETLSRLARRQQLSESGGGGRAGREGVVVSTLGASGGDEAEAQLRAVGMVWLGGVRIDWEGLPGGEQRRRVSLPTYPFERQRYWVGEGREAGGGGETKKAAGAEQRREVSEWFYLPSWKRALWPSGVAIGAGERWVVFESAGDELSRGVCERLAQAGAAVVRVRAGAAWAEVSEQEYVVRAGERADYEQLAQAVWGRGPVKAVVHLWGASAATAGKSAAVTGTSMAEGEREWERSQEQGFYSLLSLAQGLGRANVTQELQLGVVTRNVQHVAGEGELRPEWATLQGPSKVLPQEYPNLKCVSIDVAGAEPPWAQALNQVSNQMWEQAGQIIREVQGGRERVVAYRGRERWVQEYEAVQLESGEPELKRGGVYLITGGTGGIGLALGEWLGKEHEAKLVLTSRRGPEAAEKRERLQAVAGQGGEVLVRAADVSDLEAMRAVVREVKERWGGIDGVIHAAGVPGGGMIQGKRREQVAEVMRGKVEGLRVLERVLAEELSVAQRPAWVAVCSSLAAVRGGLGQVDYCGANAYLDAWAQSALPHDPTRRVSIAWGAWAEVGMAADHESSLASRWDKHRNPIHPLLDDLVQETPERIVYATDFSVDRHWVLSEHRIMGTPALPGTAYLELARAALQKWTDGQTIELTDVFFLKPLAVEAGNELKSFTIVKRNGAGLEFSIVSNSAPDRREYAKGRARIVDHVSPRQVDLQTIAEQLKGDELVFNEGTGATFNKLNEDGSPVFVSCGLRWNSLLKVKIGDNEALATLRLPDAFTSDLEHFKLHPALLDMCVGFARRYIVEGAYMPFSYERLRIKAPLTQQLYSYLKYHEERDPTRETVSFDVSIFDGEGREIVEIENFALRRVTDGKNRPVLVDTGAPQVTTSNASTTRPNAGITTAEGIIAFQRILAQPNLSQILVSVKPLEDLVADSGLLTNERLSQLQELDQLASPAAAHDRPSMATPYVAPRNDVESKLASIWQEYLGIQHVGVNDNFFELGGDSILSIRIIARAKQHGLHIAPSLIFTHPTIAALAVALPAVQDQASEPPQPTRETEQKGGGYLASDFPDADLSQEDLDDLITQFGWSPSPEEPANTKNRNDEH